MFDDLRQDVRYSARGLAQSPGFTAVAVLILTLGIGANTTIFTLASNLFFADPPHVSEPEMLVRANRYADGVPANAWTYPDYLFFRENSAGVAGLAAYAPSGWIMTANIGEVAFSAKVGFVSDNYFEVLGVRPVAGRAFLGEENRRPGQHPVTVLSYGFWQRAFAGDPAVVGARIRVNGHPCTVVGVAPRNFRGISPVEETPDLWVPIVMVPVLAPSRMDRLNRVEGSMFVWLQVVGRLHPDFTLAAAQANVDAVTSALAEEVPEWTENGEGVELLSGFRFSPDTGSRLGNLVGLLVATVAVVLAIAAVNVALLLMARTSARRKDLAVRLALGASRSRIFRQLLVEGLLLAMAGGATSFLLSFWSAELAARAFPYTFAAGFSSDIRVFLATLGVVVITALFFTMLPALRASQIRIASVIQRGKLGGGRSRLWEGLVVGQIALAVILVAGAALFVRSLAAAASVDVGFESRDRAVVSVNLGQHGYGKEEARQFAERALSEIEVVPGVVRTSMAALLPFRGMMRVAARAEGVPEKQQVVALNLVGPAYFETMGIPLISGRDLSSDDRAGLPPVAVVSEEAAKRFWPDREALGQSLELMGETPLVVAVVGNTRFHELGEEPSPFVYLALQQNEATSLSFIVETSSAPQGVLRSVEDAIRAVDSEVALTHVGTMDQLVGQVLGPYRVGAALVGSFSIVALILAAIGLYGTLSCSVIQGLRGIGIRMALGATRARLARGVVARGLVLAAIGIPIGLAVSWASARFVQGFLFQIEAHDPLSFLSVPAVLIAVVCLASWLPAWSAARVDPVVVLREE